MSLLRYPQDPASCLGVEKKKLSQIKLLPLAPEGENKAQEKG